MPAIRDLLKYEITPGRPRRRWSDLTDPERLLWVSTSVTIVSFTPILFVNVLPEALVIGSIGISALSGVGLIAGLAWMLVQWIIRERVIQTAFGVVALLLGAAVAVFVLLGIVGLLVFGIRQLF